MYIKLNDPTMLTKNMIDIYIVFAVMLQSILSLVQQILISAFNMPEDSATTFRVVLTAIPLSVAIIFSVRRRLTLFMVTYLIAFVVLIFNYEFFTHNREFLVYDSARFLLPVVIPSALCLMTISSIETVETVLYKLSWVAFILAVYYAFSLVTGRILFSKYSMSFSYALLLPMVSLYSAKKWYSVCASAFIFFMIVAIGSRGASVAFALYIFYDIFQTNRKRAVIVILFIILFLINIPTIIEFLNNFGISSRTLDLFVSGEFVSQDSGRSDLQNVVISAFNESPIKGLGLWGDRSLIGIYCHNILLELYINWGAILATAIIVTFCYIVIKLYINLNKTNRNILVKYFIATVVPLFMSNSYLTSYTLASFIGIIYLLSKKQDKYQTLFKTM